MNDIIKSIPSVAQRNKELIEYAKKKTGGHIEIRYDSSFDKILGVRLLGGTECAEELRKSVMAIQAAGKTRDSTTESAVKEEIKTRYKQLLNSCKHQNKVALDRGAAIAITVDTMLEYPKEVIMEALQKRWEWMPCANELANECDRLLEPRRQLCAAIDRKIYEIESKQRRDEMRERLSQHAIATRPAGLSKAQIEELNAERVVAGHKNAGKAAKSSAMKSIGDIISR